MDVLSIVLCAGGNVPLDKFVSFHITVNIDSNEGNGNYFSKMRLQSQYKERSIVQATYFLRHWRSQSFVGRLLKCTLAWIHLSVGMSFSVLDRVDIPLPHSESKWIRSLPEFLASISASLQLDDACVPKPQREHDGHLMDMIIQLNRFTPSEIWKLNYCRLYLQVVT